MPIGGKCLLFSVVIYDPYSFYYLIYSLHFVTLSANGYYHLTHVLVTFQETTLYGCTVKVHEPVGVVAIACPDDYPLLAFVSLFAPAVVRGNTVIIIPSEKYPLSAADLYQVSDILWFALIRMCI